MSTDTHAQAARAVDLARGLVNRDFPESCLDYSSFDLVETMWGFGVAAGGGLTLVSANTTEMAGDQWQLKISSGLAIDIPEVSGALLWANAKNRSVSIGKYYCPIAGEQGVAGVVYETFVWGGMFADVFSTNREPGTFARTVGRIRGLISNSITTAAQESHEVRQAYGGRLFQPTEGDLTMLLTMSDG